MIDTIWKRGLGWLSHCRDFLHSHRRQSSRRSIRSPVFSALHQDDWKFRFVDSTDARKTPPCFPKRLSLSHSPQQSLQAFTSLATGPNGFYILRSEDSINTPKKNHRWEWSLFTKERLSSAVDFWRERELISSRQASISFFIKLMTKSLFSSDCFLFSNISSLWIKKGCCLCFWEWWQRRNHQSLSVSRGLLASGFWSLLLCDPLFK